MAKRYSLALAPVSSLADLVLTALKICIVLLLATQSAISQSTARVQQLVSELPACSVLRTELERGDRGNGEQPYMHEMARLGVRRVLLELHAVLRGGRPDDIRVVRRLFFRKFDGADSQITDEAVLKSIEQTGLQAELDSIAHDRMARAPLYRGVDPHLWPIKHVSSFVEFFSDAVLPEQSVGLFPSGKPELLTESVLNGDVIGTQVLLKAHRFSKQELDRALFNAALSRYDNSDVIRLLLNAGASVDARSSKGGTPLMNAVAHPCNLRPLLDAGVDSNALPWWWHIWDGSEWPF